MNRAQKDTVAVCVLALVISFTQVLLLVLQTVGAIDWPLWCVAIPLLFVLAGLALFGVVTIAGIALIWFVQMWNNDRVALGMWIGFLIVLYFILRIGLCGT